MTDELWDLLELLFATKNLADCLLLEYCLPVSILVPVPTRHGLALTQRLTHANFYLQGGSGFANLVQTWKEKKNLKMTKFLIFRTGVTTTRIRKRNIITWKT